MKRTELESCILCGMERHDEELGLMRINPHEFDGRCENVKCGEVGKWAWCDRCETVEPVAELFGDTRLEPGVFYCYDCLNDELAERRARLYAR